MEQTHISNGKWMLLLCPMLTSKVDLSYLATRWILHKSAMVSRCVLHAYSLEQTQMKQECIPVGCVPPACKCTAAARGVTLTETPSTDTPLDRDPPGQRPPWTENPLWTETPPVNRIADRCKNITLPQIHCGR